MIDLSNNQLILICAAPNSGKTSLIRYLAIKNLLDQVFDYIYVITNTPEDYDFLDKRYVITPQIKKYNSKILNGIIRLQKKSDKRLLIIFDDVIGNLDFKSMEINVLVSQYRHLGSKGTTVIMSTQDIV